MQIKKYEAVDMPTAIQMIKRELGSDAVILSTRNVRKSKGTFGIFSRPMVEVTAAVDPESNKEFPASIKNRFSSSTIRKEKTEETPTWFHPLKYEIQELREEMEVLQSSRNDYPEIQKLFEELSSFKEILKTTHAAPVPSNKDVPEPLRKMVDHLVQNDVDSRIVDKILSGIQKRLPGNAYNSEQILEKTIRRILKNILRVQGGIRLSGEKPKKVALIGPTGVGKTTTIAKIAAHYSLAKKKKVALVTIDTYRIAAIEQLKIYAKIIGIPVDIIVHEEDLDKIFHKHNDKDLILVDTAGRSHRNISQIKELRSMLAGRHDIEKHLVLSATTKQSDITSILRSFKAIDFNYLLFTKIDEGSRFGTILNAVLESNKYISYITNGQRVPEDIREARIELLENLILAPNGNHLWLS